MSGLEDASDTDLITACRAGNEAAWSTLVQRYQRLVYAIPRRSGLDEDDAAEIFQRTFVKLVEHLDRITQTDRLAAWIVTTAKRETWRYSKLARRTEPLPNMSDDGDEPVDIVDEGPLPGETLAALEQQQVIRRALAGLDERCRKLLTLLYYTQETPSYTVIASTLEMSEGSIGPTRARCLQKLRKTIEKGGL